MPDEPTSLDDEVVRDEERLEGARADHRAAVGSRRDAKVISSPMAKPAERSQPIPSPELQRLAEQGRVKRPSRRLADVLAERGPLRGAVSDAGSRALQEQRGKRD